MKSLNPGFSLRSRLSLGLAASLVLLLALQWVVATVVIEQLVERQLVGRLNQDAENLLAGIDLAGRRLALNPARVSTVYQRPFSGHYYVIATADQIETSRSLWDDRINIPDLQPGQQTISRMQGPEQQPLLLVARGYRKHGEVIRIGVAQNLTEVNAGLRQFQIIHGSISFAILVVLLVVQRLVVTRAIKPLQQARQDMQRLERGEIDQISTQVPQEILPLISELNRLLAAMGKKTQRSRESLGNLAHALKTQVALLNQVTEQQELTRLPELKSRLRVIGEGMRSVIERELRRARLLGSSLPGKRLDLRQAVSRLVQTLQHMYADKTVAIDWGMPEDAVFALDEEDLLELLGNVLDNACKWCKRQVRLEVLVNGSLLVTVEDDGPGCDPAMLSGLTERGFRLDESKPGSGLGLAIVQDIVESYGGTMEFGASTELKGLRVEIRLPVTATTNKNGP